MPCQVVVVHDDPGFLEDVTTILRTSGHEVATYTDSMTALNAIEAAQCIDVLVTRPIFPVGTPNGVSLALVLRTKYPKLKVVFAALSEMEDYTQGIGEFIAHPVDMTRLVETVARLCAELA